MNTIISVAPTRLVFSSFTKYINRAILGFISVIATTLCLSANASASILLEIDLSVENQIGISSTGNSALIDSIGTDFEGVYLDQFFGFSTNISDQLISGNLVTATELSSNTPNLFSFTGDIGLNIFSMTNNATISTTAGQTAFTGSGLWNISSQAYASAFMGALSGDLFLNADSASDLSNPNADTFLIGTWAVTSSTVDVSAPTMLSVFWFLVLVVMLRKEQVASTALNKLRK